jgi:DNA-binding transcriptional ArsR family regulator
MIRRPDLMEIREQTRRAAALGGDTRVAEAVDLAELTARFFRVLGDPTRLRLLALLLDAPTGERSVGELVTALDAPQSRISTHLGCLRWCGLVHARREGKQVYLPQMSTPVETTSRMGSILGHTHQGTSAGPGGRWRKMVRLGETAPIRSGLSAYRT